ncbi:MAG TPA: response regulator [Chthoniobacterales bacterium]
MFGRDGNDRGSEDGRVVPGDVSLPWKVLLYLPFDSEVPSWISSVAKRGFQVEVRTTPDLPSVAHRPDAVLIDTSDRVEEAVRYVKRAQVHFGGQAVFTAVLVHSPDFMRTQGKRLLDAGASRVFQPTNARDAQILTGLKVAFTPGYLDPSLQFPPLQSLRPLPPAGEAGASHNHILLVVDDPVIANLLTRILEEGEFTTTVIPDVEAAMRWLEHAHPAAVLLDSVLPGLAGLEAVKRFHAPRATGTALPVVVFVGTLAPVSENQLLEAGAAQVYRKADVDARKLLNTFAALLRRAPSDEHGVGFDDKAAAFSKPDSVLFGEIREVLMQQAPGICGELLRLLGQVAHEENPETEKLKQLHRKLHSLAGHAGLAGLSRVSTLAGALASLVDELLGRNASFTHSIRRTLAQGIELTTELFGRADEFMPATIPVLAVDDEEVSRRVLSHALQKVDLRPTVLSSSEEALPEVRARRYDLIFLDVEMPGLSGLELCRRIRELPAYRTTPVVFVTSKDSLAISLETARSGGTDFIKKPFGLRELAVKALIYLLEQPGTPPSSG